MQSRVLQRYVHVRFDVEILESLVFTMGWFVCHLRAACLLRVEEASLVHDLITRACVSRQDIFARRVVTWILDYKQWEINS